MARLEREWERKYQELEVGTNPYIEQEKAVESSPILPTSAPLPPYVEAIRQEAQGIVDQRTGIPVGGDAVAVDTIDPADTTVERARRGKQPFSIQSPATDVPSEVGGSLVWWTGGSFDRFIPLAEYGNPQRTLDLRNFALVSQFILNAEAILTKKVQALQWTVEGGRNLAQKWQRRLNNFENGDGWDTFVAKWVRVLCESDKLSVAELIRAAPAWAVDENSQLTPRGEKALADGKDKVWEIVDASVCDPVNIFPTTSLEFPVSYHNPYTGRRYALRPYNFMSLVDMPTADDRFPGHGVSAISRAVWAAQEDRMVQRYVMEEISENPGAGIGIINASTTALQTALKDAEQQRQARGVVYYKGVIFLPVLDPSGGTKLEFLSFANLPDGFNRSEVYNIIKEIVATAFGLDILEFGSISGRLGTATQAKVAAQKSRTKSIGAIMQGIERQFKYKLLPESITFSIKKRDMEEERARADIDEIYFNNAVRYAQFAPPEIANQYLIEKGAVPSEPPFIMPELQARTELIDTEPAEPENVTGEESPSGQSPEAVAEGPEGAAEEDIVKRWYERSRIRIDRNGKVTNLEMPYYTLLAAKRRRRRSPLPGSTIDESDATRAYRRLARRLPDYASLLERSPS
jgi:hypothetical protein